VISRVSRRSIASPPRLSPGTFPSPHLPIRPLERLHQIPQNLGVIEKINSISRVQFPALMFTIDRIGRFSGLVGAP